MGSKEGGGGECSVGEEVGGDEVGEDLSGKGGCVSWGPREGKMRGKGEIVWRLLFNPGCGFVTH